MNGTKMKIVKVVGIVLVGLVVSGCSANRISLADTGKVSIQKHDSGKVKILWADVYQKDGKNWAYAVLKQQAGNSSAMKTHLDIQVLSEEGAVQYEGFSDDVYVPRNRVGKGPDWKRIRMPLPDELPIQSQIKVIVHNGQNLKNHKPDKS